MSASQVRADKRKRVKKFFLTEEIVGVCLLFPGRKLSFLKYAGWLIIIIIHQKADFFCSKTIEHYCPAYGPAWKSPEHPKFKEVSRKLGDAPNGRVRQRFRGWLLELSLISCRRGTPDPCTILAIAKAILHSHTKGHSNLLALLLFTLLLCGNKASVSFLRLPRFCHLFWVS